MGKKVNFDTLRSLAYTSISGSYAAVGAAFAYAPRIICITNSTDADMIFSDDSSNSTGKLFVVKGTYKLFDLTANLVPDKDDSFVIAVGTTFYVKQVTAPTLGRVCIECIYG